MRRAALLLVLGAVAAGCGGGDDDEGDAAPPPAVTQPPPAQTEPAPAEPAQTAPAPSTPAEKPAPAPDEPADAPAAETPRAGLTVGIGEHGIAMFDQPAFRRLGIRHARLVTAWDTTSVRFEREIVDAWLAAAQRAGAEPFITFAHSRVKPEKLPSVAEYTAAVRRFHRRYPDVRVYAPWNEINHASQPTAGNPERAADYYRALRGVCADCTIVAADVLDQAGVTAYLARFKARLGGEQPRLWGLHNYSDTNRFRDSGTREVLRAVKGDVWLTETGGIAKFGRSFPFGLKRQARAVRYMFRLARSSPRIKRIYIYNWTGAPRDARFDAGLVSPAGRPRPAYRAVARALGR